MSKNFNEPEGVFTTPDEGKVIGTVIVNPKGDEDADVVITLRKKNVDENGDFDLHMDAKVKGDPPPLDTIPVTISVASKEEKDADDET